jgi:hypothetical protein
MVIRNIDNQNMLVDCIGALLGTDQYASIVISGSVGLITGLFIFIRQTLSTVPHLSIQSEVLIKAIDWTHYPNMEQYMKMFRDNVAIHQNLSKVLGRPEGPTIPLGIENPIINPVRWIMPDIPDQMLYSRVNDSIVNIIK